MKQKSRTKALQHAVQETQTSNLFKGGEISGRASKSLNVIINLKLVQAKRSCMNYPYRTLLLTDSTRRFFK